MLEKSELISLAKVVARADKNSPTAYSFNNESYDYRTLNETLRRELNEYVGTYQAYRENKNLSFALV